MKLLRDEGRCGIVLPDGFLYAEGVATRIKEKLLSEFNLHTVVRLPNGVFNPYAGGRTNILFFEKGKPTKEIWFFEHQLPDGYKTYGKTKPITIKEFDLEKEWWNDRDSANFSKYAWLVGIDEIKRKNYNLDLSNPFKIRPENNLEAVFEEFEKNKANLAISISTIKEELRKIAEREETFSEKWSLVSQHFEEMVLNVANIRKLRQAILNFAVMGKIVEQDPEDEPAFVLLKKIGAKKEKIVENSSAKKETRLPILEEDTPYELPKGWTWARLGDYFYLQTGATPSTKVRQYWGGDIKWLKSGDVNMGEIYDCEGRITEEGLNNSNCKILFPDSILIALNGQGKTRGTVAMLRTEAACNQSLVSMRSYDKGLLVPEYLYYFLKANYMRIREITGHKQRHGLNMKIIGNILVAIPPSREQVRIVERVKQLMSLCEELEQRVRGYQANSEILMEAVFKEAFAS
jgi:hypothetical protein